MTRIFNHYVHAATVRAMLFDGCLVLLIATTLIGLHVSNLRDAVPLAGTPVVSLAACLFVINHASGLYESSQATTPARSAVRALLVLLITLPLAYAIFGLLPPACTNRETVQLSMMVSVAGLIVRRAYLSHASAADGRTRIMVFGAGPAAQLVGQTLQSADPNAHIVGYLAGPNECDVAVPESEILARDGTLPEMAEKLRVDEIVVALTERRAGSMPLRELLDCKATGTKVYDLNTHFEKTLGQIRVDYLSASWLIFGDGFNQGSWRTAVKRVFDIVCAALLLLVSSPMMVAAGLAIKLESRGPALYRQARVGQNGRTFSITKFRSMRTDAEKDGQPLWAQANDERVTGVGHFIRRMRIDELPQLFNVLMGDMSLVGPRPERPFFVDRLTHEIPFYALRHSVKPGLTGWAQVRYPYGATVEDSQEKLQFDLYYVKNHTLFLDLVILMETISVVLTGKGAR